jgi:hypothetical protein
LTEWAVRRAARAGGFDLVRRNFYSPIAHAEELPAETFERPSPLAGITWEAPRYEAFLRDLAPWWGEFELPAGFSWENQLYGPVETEVLYALIRRGRPRRIVELGSGFSSLVIASACRRNAEEGSPCAYKAFDPHPRAFMHDLAGLSALQAVGACAVPREVFDGLEAGDVLFVDTTHTVKIGSEVNRLLLDVLPRLAPGVLIHVHDVFLPYEYPRDFLLHECFWQEQYLLQALLAENPNFEIVFPAWAVVHERPGLISELFPQHARRVFGPGAFWLRRVGAL